jgi:hypothetical protein
VIAGKVWSIIDLKRISMEQLSEKIVGYNKSEQFD